MRSALIGTKMPSKERIAENVDRLVELDRQYQTLLGLQDAPGLLALASIATESRMHGVARKASRAAAELQG